MRNFIAISKAIETEPVMMFQFMVLDLLKTFLRAGLQDNKEQLLEDDLPVSEQVQVIQLAFLRGMAIDWKQAQRAVEVLGARFKRVYGGAFRLGKSE